RRRHEAGGDGQRDARRADVLHGHCSPPRGACRPVRSRLALKSRAIKSPSIVSPEKYARNPAKATPVAPPTSDYPPEAAGGDGGAAGAGVAGAVPPGATGAVRSGRLGSVVTAGGGEPDVDGGVGLTAGAAGAPVATPVAAAV